MKTSIPPKLFLKFFRWYCHPKLVNHIEGDLLEVYAERVKRMGKIKADFRFILDVLLLFRRRIVRPIEGHKNLNTYGMYESYFKMGWRGLLKNRGHAYINVLGLAVGMAVTMLIGLWVKDELSFNRYHKNYDRIAQVFQHQTIGGERRTNVAVPVPLSRELVNSYKEDFKHVVPMWWEGSHLLTLDDKKIPRNGVFMGKEGLEMFSFPMIRGSWKSLDDPASTVLSELTAKALFGDQDPVGQMLRVDNKMDVKVTGVFEELPANSRFYGLQFMSSWDLWLSSNPWLKDDENTWNSDDINFTDMITFVEIMPGNSFESISKKIERIKFNKLPPDVAARENPSVFLQPMSRWHLYAQWKDGKENGGRIQFVWLFGVIGFFVLMLACINFMNLSTAQSEMRAKEVGIRKAIGSERVQLISQFFMETFLIVLSAFVLAVGVATLALPGFNQLAEKDLTIPWMNPTFAAMVMVFILFTSFVAGCYPALVLSSFQPVKVLKGTFRVGRLASAPRKTLVVMQFFFSVVLIIGTIAVWRQIQFAKDRPIGYTREGLIMVRKTSSDFWGKIRPLRNKLEDADAIVNLAEASNPVTETWFTFNDFNWQGKDPDARTGFSCTAVSHQYGETMGWNFVQGRDFSNEFSTDSSAVILNQTAARLIGWKDPVNEEIMWRDKKFHVIGVIQDMIVDSPYEPVKPGVYLMQSEFSLNTLGNVWINIRLNPNLGLTEAILRVKAVFEAVFPAVPFEFKFIDQEYERKFASEERIGKLASLFAILAIFISCLGLFGLASFVAQQRTKEIGIRKVMGASVLQLWKMLSKDFILLVGISIFISIPVSYYGLSNWLENYEYRAELAWWIFAASAAGALLITLATVSYHAVSAALVNPVKSLRSE